jgi:hypothetical protein
LPSSAGPVEGSVPRDIQVAGHVAGCARVAVGTIRESARIMATKSGECRKYDDNEEKGLLFIVKNLINIYGLLIDSLM